MLTPNNVTLAQYNEAILNGNEKYVRIVFPTQNITLTGDDISADGGLIINQILNAEQDLVMGRAVMAETVIRFINSSVFAGFDWTEEFHIDFGVKINNSINWVTVGYFKGKKPKRTVGVNIIEFSAYDRMQMFNELADDFVAGLTFPCTMADIYDALCDYVGISYVSGDEMQNAMAMQYSENPFVNGVTCRDILSYIAEANCCYARITADGNVKLIWYIGQTYTLTEDDHFGVVVDETEVPAIDTVRISSTEDENAGSVYPVGSNDVIYNIIDNSLLLCLDAGDRTTVMTDILTRLDAFGAYTPASVDAVGNWMVETGDIITVVHDGNQAVNIPIFVRGFVFDGGCGDMYESTGSADREMSPTTREQYEQGGKLGRKYSIVSGVDINEDGVTVSGGKYVKIRSGGVFDVQSSNFKIDSDTGVVESGDWKFYDGGLRLREEIDGHNVDMQIGDDAADQGAYYTLFMDRDVKQFQQGINTHYAPILKFGAIDNRGESDDFSWGLDVDYVENPITPLGLGFPGLLPKGNNNWHLGSEDNPWGTAHIRIGNIGIVQADDVATKDFKCSPDAFTTLAGIVNALANGSTGDVFTMRFASGLTGQFFDSSNNYAGVLIVVKASSSNAYFFAFNRAAASIGNISIDNGTVNSKTMLS